MRKNYDFSGAIKNPHAGKFKDGYTIIVNHNDYDEIITITKTKKPKGEDFAGVDSSATFPVMNT